MKPTVIVVQPDEEVTFSLQLISKSDLASARMLEIAASQSLLWLWPDACTCCGCGLMLTHIALQVCMMLT